MYRRAIVQLTQSPSCMLLLMQTGGRHFRRTWGCGLPGPGHHCLHNRPLHCHLQVHLCCMHQLVCCARTCAHIAAVLPLAYSALVTNFGHLVWTCSSNPRKVRVSEACREVRHITAMAISPNHKLIAVAEARSGQQPQVSI